MSTIEEGDKIALGFNEIRFDFSRPLVYPIDCSNYIFDFSSQAKILNKVISNYIDKYGGNIRDIGVARVTGQVTYNIGDLIYISSNENIFLTDTDQLSYSLYYRGNSNGTVIDLFFKNILPRKEDIQSVIQTIIGLRTTLLRNSSIKKYGGISLFGFVYYSKGRLRVSGDFYIIKDFLSTNKFCITDKMINPI